MNLLLSLADAEKIFLEPSALAGMYGPVLVEKADAFTEYHGVKNATHVVWATGGSMVPSEEMEKYYQTGRSVRDLT